MKELGRKRQFHQTVFPIERKGQGFPSSKSQNTSVQTTECNDVTNVEAWGTKNRSFTYLSIGAPLLSAGVTAL